jgi:hypothetical protein
MTPVALPPTVVTEPASSVTQRKALLKATVNPNELNVSECKFEYGKPPAYDKSIPCSFLPGEGTSAVAVSALVTGLEANTPYHFRIFAKNAGGPSTGGEQTFTTLPIGTVAGGSFVIGDEHALVGEPVRFWSYLWTLFNPLSGGGSPFGFSGFATKIPNNPPKCGDSWTSGLPGLFSKVPATVPELMDVIVSSSITSDLSWSASAYHGNTTRVVLIETNPGYGPDWSHPGTGKVVSQVCP